MLLADEWGAVVVDIEPLYASNTDRMVFAKPADNGIRIMSSDYLTFEFQPPYYGDTVNLKFWKLLGIDFGGLSGTTPLTRVDGYKYIYNHSIANFSVYNSEDVLISSVDNIKSIGDMNIDFTIFNSHQFEIIFDYGDGGIRFIFPAGWLKRLYPAPIENPIYNGVNNIYFQDRIRPYGSTDVDNPLNDIKHIGGLEETKVREIYNSIIVHKENAPKISSLNYTWDIDYDNNIPNNDFGRDGFDIEATKLKIETLRGVREELDWLLPILSANMYPRLLPILRPGEVHVNRPVYEPWLIMGMPTRESIIDYDKPFEPDPDNPDPDNPIPHPPPIITDDPEDERFIIPVFDLSPRWG